MRGFGIRRLAVADMHSHTLFACKGVSIRASGLGFREKGLGFRRDLRDTGRWRAKEEKRVRQMLNEKGILGGWGDTEQAE